MSGVRIVLLVVSLGVALLLTLNAVLGVFGGYDRLRNMERVAAAIIGWCLVVVVVGWEP